MTYSGREYSSGDFGSFNSKDPHVLRLNEYLINKLETATGDQRDALLFLIAVTVLHEYVHYGDNKKDNKMEGERVTKNFEMDVYGEIINESNAQQKIELWKLLQDMKKQSDSETQRDENNQNAIKEIKYLPEGTYLWDGVKWVKQN